MRIWKTATAVTALAAALTGVPAQAAAAPEPGVLGIGRTVFPIRDTGLYSAPGLSTPRSGTAWVGNEVAALCTARDSNGAVMALAINKSGRNGVQWSNTAGYIWQADFSGDMTLLLSCDFNDRFYPRRDAAMYSGPGLSTPRIGTAWFDRQVIGMCRTTDNVGNRMVLSIQVAGQNGVQWAYTAGYIWDVDIQGNTSDLLNCV
ncbi:hypothetical protein [Lentzea flaviverrucosa]|uniref:Uncharacterized protein n=1 Tax=Lentzea flaviverrucosa TaxID=200379 RepID=A0A1H9BVA4_9PSEU|nr:hypothetical protein [Lentzea flaviverrucosa]RDI31676.1 hypothetical protein DFR72_10376 [Lentzea flaviverrucosa]SEP92278.1 hypothetical protein SAMN05216195_101581 [Lentzea flaviverrucosa]